MTTPPRIAFIQIDETAFDNLIFAREQMESEYNLKPEHAGDVIAILLNYWFDGRRSL